MQSSIINCMYTILYGYLSGRLHDTRGLCTSSTLWVWVRSYLRALSTSYIRGIFRGIFRLASYLRGVTSLSSFLRGTPCLRSLYNGRMLYLDIFYIFSTQSSLIVFIVLLIPISGFFRIVIALIFSTYFLHNDNSLPDPFLRIFES